MENQDIIILMSLSGYCYPESDMKKKIGVHFPDSNNRKVITFRIYDPESEPRFFSSCHFPDITIRKVITFRIAISGK